MYVHVTKFNEFNDPTKEGKTPQRCYWIISLRTNQTIFPSPRFLQFFPRSRKNFQSVIETENASPICSQTEQIVAARTFRLVQNKAS